MDRERVEWLMAPDSMDAQTLFDVFKRPEWHARAACRGMGTDVFFPERGQSTKPAMDVCEGCEVRGHCLESAMTLSDKHGIWGGLSERNRRVLRRSAA